MTGFISVSAVAASSSQVNVIGGIFVNADPGPVAQVRYRINANGNEEAVEGTGPIQIINQWLADGGDPSRYEAQYTGTGAGTTPENKNQWYGCELSPEWGLIKTGGAGLDISIGDIQIRAKTGTNVQAEAPLRLEVEIL